MHDAMKAYHESWERELDRQFLKNDRYRKRAYICSPLSGSTAEEELSNIWRARAYMLYARTMLGYLARAPHAYLPMLLCDHVAAERALALQFGLQLLEQSEVLLICGDRISRGMKGEISIRRQRQMCIRDRGFADLRGSHQPWYEGRNPSCRPVGNPHYRILRRPLFGCSQAGDTGRSG